MRALVNMRLSRQIDLPLLETELDEARKLALVSSPKYLRNYYSTLFALDGALGRIVSSTNEVILGQMRLAWWRDQFEKPLIGRPAGNHLLEAIGAVWGEDSTHLANLVNGWEVLLVEEDWSSDGLYQFADARSGIFRAIASKAGAGTYETEIDIAAKRWALVDLAQHSSTAERAEKAINQAVKLGPERQNLPKTMRVLTVLDGLARRAIEKQNTQLLGDRLSPIAALRLGIFGI